jgi:hypothetical protein
MTETAETICVERELGRLMAAFLGAVSFQPGSSPDYARIRRLFIRDGLLIKNSGAVPEIARVEEFIAPRRALVDSGALTAFDEAEIAARTEVFGNVAHRISTYEKRGVQDGVTFRAVGVIFTQFIATPAGWRMTAMAWDDERPGLEMPGKDPSRPGF